MADTYETQFTKDNILNLSEHLKSSIKQYSNEHLSDNKKLDVFLAIAALANVSFEYIVQTIPTSDEEHDRLMKEMKGISDGILKNLNEMRAKDNTLPVSDLAANAHTLAILSEHFARMRDQYINKIAEEANVAKESESENQPE